MHIKLFLNKLKIFLVLIYFLVISTSYVEAQDCKSKIEIMTNNPSALIYIDNVLVGNGNYSAVIEKGSHTVLVKENTVRWNAVNITDTINIADCDKKYIYNYELKSSELKKVNSSNYEFIMQTKRESFFNSTSFKLLIGSAAIFGGVAAYLKIKADKKYDEYLLNRNQSVLDEVNRLDLLSGISFSLLQINFGYLIYKFLTD